MFDRLVETNDGCDTPVARVITRLGWVLTSSPAAFLAFLALHALHVRAYLGRWPVVYRDEPDSLLLSAHEYVLLVPTLYASLFAVPTWLLLWAILGPLGLVNSRVFTDQLGLMVTVFLAGIVVAYLLVTADPTGYIEWFLD